MDYQMGECTRVIHLTRSGEKCRRPTLVQGVRVSEILISRRVDFARGVTESAVRIVLRRRFDAVRKNVEARLDGMSGNHQQRRLPSEKQKTILRLLAAADGPMCSAELQRRAGLLTGEFRGAIYWLRDKGYIEGVVKTIKTFGIGLANNRKAFWSILPKGRESLEPH
jgi:hypothetical protein